MGTEDWERELEGIYQRILPASSRAREADNPGRAHVFFKNLSPDYWPFLALCAETEMSKFTWHHACDEHRLEGLLKGAYNEDVSARRGRLLKVIELYHRPENLYYLLEQ